MLVGALVAIFLLSFDYVESQCLNCEAPNGPYCCKTSYNGQCCEYPLDRSAKSGGHLSPLEKQLKQFEERQRPIRTTVIPNITITEH